MRSSYQLLPAINGITAVSALCFRFNGDQSYQTQTTILYHCIVNSEGLEAVIRACLCASARRQFFDDMHQKTTESVRRLTHSAKYKVSASTDFSVCI
jgi:hypothetical protein